MPGPPVELEALIGYHFADPSLLERALTHRSLSYEQPDKALDNERLEFLGDSIIGFLISEAVYASRPDLSEGRLSKIKSQLVSAIHLYQVARALGIGEYLRLGRSEELSGGRAKRALLADAVEALIAAIYLDSGIDAARLFVETHLLSGVDLTALDNESLPADHKGALQEMAQRLRLPQPRYITIRENGPEHAKMFTVEARVGPAVIEQGEGPSKKAASQIAASRALKKLSAEAAADPAQT